MASSSLTNMNTFAAGGTTAAVLMPKLKYRFRVSFIGLAGADDNTVLTRQIIDFKRPTVDFAVTEMPTYNSIIKIAGKPKWSDVSCKIRDDATNKVTNLVEAQMLAQFDYQNQASAAQAADYKFSIKLEMLDGGNGLRTAIAKETWIMYGCYFKKASYGDLAYSSSDVLEVSLDIRFDNAVQVDATGEVLSDGGIGALVDSVATDSNSTK